MNALIILFYRIVTFFTRVPAKTRAANSLIRNSLFNENKPLNTHYISSQTDLCDVPYGKEFMNINGCGPIALYNAICSISDISSDFSNNPMELTFSSVISYLEQNGCTLFGKLGTSPHVINNYLKDKGYSTKTFLLKNEDKLNSFSEDFDVFISLIFNNRHDIRKGLHFICTIKDGDSCYKTFNPDFTAKSLSDALSMCSHDKIRHIYTIGIKNN